MLEKFIFNFIRDINVTPNSASLEFSAIKFNALTFFISEKLDEVSFESSISEQLLRAHLLDFIDE